jgi:hypothetical protein
MRLRRVTLSGVDQTIRVSDLIELSRDYPFVEWGILASSSNYGFHIAGDDNNGKTSYSTKYPSTEWIAKSIMELKAANANVSLHWCGITPNYVMRGDANLHTPAPKILSRLQLNGVISDRPVSDENRTAYLRLATINPTNVPTIFQCKRHWECRVASQIISFQQERSIILPVIQLLFDESGGRGRLPDVWPPVPRISLERDDAWWGYSGGLNAQNIDQEILRIQEAVDSVNPNASIWVDMESGLRSSDPEDHNVFDLGRAERVLRSLAPFISE